MRQTGGMGWIFQGFELGGDGEVVIGMICMGEYDC